MPEALLEENRRLAQRCIELESAARKEVEKLRAANAALSRGGADLRVLLENAAVGLALVDQNLHIASANKTLADMLGYAGAELPGVIFSNFVYVGKLPAFTRLVVRNARNTRADDIVELVARDGSLVPCRIEASDWLDEAGARQGHIFLVFDAGAEVRAIARLRDAEQALAEAEWSRRLFLDVVGRELATPAFGIMGMANTLLATTLDDGQKELTELMHAAARSLLRLVTDVVDVAHVGAAETKPQPVPVNIADFAGGTVHLFARRAEEKGLELRIHIGPAVPEAAMLDPRVLRCVLAHLLDNALKFTDRGHIALSVDGIGDNLRFMISDTGSGLDATAQEELFKSALAPESATSLRHGGIGVGLAICRRLAASMGGRLAFESIPGGGSEFHVLIPLIKAPEEE